MTEVYMEMLAVIAFTFIVVSALDWSIPEDDN